MVETTVSATAVRRLAVAAQGYAGRYRRATESSVEAAIRRLSCVQLDSISTVERSHRIALTSRVGNYPRESVSHLLARAGSSSSGRTRHACSRSSRGRSSGRAMQNGGRDWYSNVNDVKSPSRARRRDPRPRSARTARSRPGSSRAQPAAACGTGSRRRRCSSGSGTTASS